MYSKRTSIRGKAETSVCPADRPTSGDLCSTGGSPWTLCCYDIEFWPAPNVLVCSCRDGEGRYLCNAGHSRACTSIIGADGPVLMPASQPTPEPNEPTNEPTNDLTDEPTAVTTSVTTIPPTPAPLPGFGIRPVPKPVSLLEPINIGGNTNNNSEDDASVQDQRLNLILVPQCDPSNSDSFYSLSKREENRGRTDYLEDNDTDCEKYLQYCDKKRSNVDMSWPNYVYPEEFYTTVEQLYSGCFKSCAEYLPGGVEEFCSMPEPNDAYSASYNSGSGSDSYCESVSNSEWTKEMYDHEIAVLRVLNSHRDELTGTTCTRRQYNESGKRVVTQTYFPRSSGVITNDSLRCAARIQARNIVKDTIERDRFPSNLHTACPDSNFDGTKPTCEKFSTRMVNAGYSYHENGFGYINEVTAVGYRTAEQVIQGWLDSQSGHCSAIVKQESLVVPTEVGIGFYRDEETGMTGHVMLLGQRQL